VRRILVIALAGTIFGCTASAQREEPCRLVIDWNSSPPPRERAIWLAYLMHRANHAGPVANCSNSETVVVPTFDQEAEAHDATIETYLEIQKRDPELYLPYFEDLSRVQAAGFMREYVWVYLRQESWMEQPSGLRVSQFDTWRETNLRDHVPQTQGSVKALAQ
jgi:hypothetical protein